MSDTSATTDLLTAKEIQTLLQVDRSTIYRLAEAGRLPAIKVGRQWRFPARLIESWLKTQALATAAPPMPSRIETGAKELADLLPLPCVQLIQDSYADALGVMMVITDMAGQPVTRVSHPCGLFEVISEVPEAAQLCVEGWRQMAVAIDLEPKFAPNHIGLLCARGLIRVGAALKGMLFVGGIAPANWPPTPEQAQQIAARLGMTPEMLAPHLDEVFYLDSAGQARILSFVQRIADIIAHIVNERKSVISDQYSVISY
jgi:PTS system nitrogen regulatory IIA component